MATGKFKSEHVVHAMFLLANAGLKSSETGEMVPDKAGKVGRAKSHGAL